MIKAKRYFLYVVFFLIFTACSQRPIPIAKVPKTPTPFPLLAELTLTVTQPLPSRISTAAMPADFSPILYGKKYDANTFFILLGGLQGDRWLVPDVTATYFAKLQDVEYDAYTLAGKFQVHGYPPQFSPTSKMYTIGTDVTLDEFGMVGVARGWPVLQRNVQELSSDNELYRQAVLDWLTAQGIAAPEVGTLRVFRVDLEGDGADEVFISATHLENQHAVKPGDYSVILMRRVEGNNVVTLPLLGDVYSSEEAALPQTYSLGNFLDLNQDGALEVIVDVERWEWAGAFIYQIDGQNITHVL